MSNSPLIAYTKLSPNKTSPRNHRIDTISIHCMAGDLSVESCGAMFAKPSRKASSNYGIGSDGRIALYVDESDRSWCTSSKSNDNRAITIEVANNGGAPDWPVSDKAYAALLDLLTDICRRNGIQKLLWKGDQSLIGQIDKQNMTVHRWFAAKACPGDYLYNRHGAIADAVNKRLEDDNMTQEQFNTMMEAYLWERGSLPPSDWSRDAREWAETEGLIYGDEKGDKQYQNFVTREQMCTFLKRFSEM